MNSKNLLLTIALLISSSCLLAQFQASFVNTGNNVSFRIRPQTTTTTGFSTIEFFVRYPEGSTPFTYGPIIENTTNFPGIGQFTVERFGSAEGGYVTDYFYYTAGQPVTGSRTYNAGTEYEVFSVKLIGPSTSTVDLQLVQSPDDDPFYVALLSELGNDLRAPLNTIFYPTTNTTGDPYTLTLSGVLLPVKFISFTVQKKNDDAFLQWNVTNEAKNLYFEIERSENGRNFTSVGRVNSLGTTDGINAYQFTDKQITALKRPILQYRIRQVDNDSKSSYSRINSVRLDNKATLTSLYPNPARHSAVLSLDLPEADRIYISIVDAHGKVVHSSVTNFARGYNQHTLNIATYAHGTYDVYLKSATLTQNFKLIKQ